MQLVYLKMEYFKFRIIICIMDTKSQQVGNKEGNKEVLTEDHTVVSSNYYSSFEEGNKTIRYLQDIPFKMQPNIHALQYKNETRSWSTPL